MPETIGLNYLALSVSDLQDTKNFFVNILGWEESGYDASYPRTAVSDGFIKLTLWQVNKSLNGEPFNRRKNVGLHYVAIQVKTEEKLKGISKKYLFPR